MGEIFVEPQQFVPACHLLARRIDENDDGRTDARLRRKLAVGSGALRPA
jgi:hypothetical protein